ncbi:hypothetical protein [Paenibacillus larvae]|nr:hypothetical protein [Paenibacillus larvae]
MTQHKKTDEEAVSRFIEILHHQVRRNLKVTSVISNRTTLPFYINIFR